LSAVRKGEDHQITLIIDPKNGLLQQVHFDNFIFDLKKGFTHKNLDEIFNFLVSAKVKRIRKRTMLIFFTYEERFHWSNKNGVSLTLSAMEDKNVFVTPMLLPTGIIG